MNLRPLHDRIVVRRLDEGEESVGGIIVPDTAREKRRVFHARQRTTKGKRDVAAGGPADERFRAAATRSFPAAVA